MRAKSANAGAAAVDADLTLAAVLQVLELHTTAPVSRPRAAVLADDAAHWAAAPAPWALLAPQQPAWGVDAHAGRGQ